MSDYAPEHDGGSDDLHVDVDVEVADTPPPNDPPATGMPDGTAERGSADVDAPDSSAPPAGEPDAESADVVETDSDAPGPEPVESEAPETGDLVIDAALRDLAAAPEDDLDAQIDKGEQVQSTLQGRLSDLGG